MGHICLLLPLPPLQPNVSGGRIPGLVVLQYRVKLQVQFASGQIVQPSSEPSFNRYNFTYTQKCKGVLSLRNGGWIVDSEDWLLGTSNVK